MWMAVFENVFEKKHVSSGCLLYLETEKWPMASLTALNSLHAKKDCFGTQTKENKRLL